MSDILIFNDNASFASSDTFSTQDSIEQPRHSLRRRNTVSQLTRRVSKRISRKILGAGVQEHALSEKNLKDLNNATDIDPPNLCSPAHQVDEVRIYDPIHEEIEEECPIFDVEAAREMRLHQSYATFCQNFTLSGTTRMSRKFDLSMGTERAEEHTRTSHEDQTLKNDTTEFSGSHASPEHITVQSRPRPNTVAFPISCPSTHLDDTPIPHSATVDKPSSEWPVTETSKIQDNFNGISTSSEIMPNSNYPQPPPRIITPTVWMERQRNERERKAARRQRLLNRFRSWFMTSQHSWGRRHGVE